MPDNAGKLRLRTPKGEYVFIEPGDVLMARSIDHWVKVLVKEGEDYVWYESHCTLGNLMLYKAAEHLERVSKFYGINKARVTHYHHKSHTLEFDDSFSYILEHPLKAYTL